VQRIAGPHSEHRPVEDGPVSASQRPHQGAIDIVHDDQPPLGVLKIHDSSPPSSLLVRLDR